jgi:hypothetical protein
MLQQCNETLARYVMHGANMVTPTTCNDLNCARDSSAPWIRVRLKREYVPSRGKRFEYSVGVALLCFIDAPNRMHEEDEVRRTQFGVLLICRGRDCGEPIDGW